MQTTSALFETIAKDTNLRPVAYQGRVSWTKDFDPDVEFFTLDTSVLNGIDLLSPSADNPIQEFDYYDYVNVTDRLISLEVSRELEFPYSVASAIADFKLENHDDYYTPNSGSPVSSDVLPSRPVRLFMGFNTEVLQQFVGMTEGMPDIDDLSKDASFHAVDWFGKLFSLKTPNVVAMQNVTTDEVMAELFDSAGLLPSQYDLPTGRNVIKYLTYDKGTTLGYIIRQLMQAEMGQLFMDEQGVIRFIPRLEADLTPDYIFDDENIVDIRTINVQNIINVVEINADIREVQTKQPMFTLSDTISDDFVVSASSTKDIFVALDNPALTATTPTAGESSTDSYYIATNLAGTVVGSVTIDSDFLFTDTYRMTVNNANAFDIRLSEFVLWGEPAKIVDTINYIREDTDSITKYEERVLVIDNNFLQSVEACDAFALTVLRSYAEYAGDIELVVRGTPALQLGDIIDVTKDTYTGQYRITKIVNKIVGKQFEQILNARRYIPENWFQLDVSLLDGENILAP